MTHCLKISPIKLYGWNKTYNARLQSKKYYYKIKIEIGEKFWKNYIQ